MTDLKNINLEKCLELLKRKKISSKELVSFYLKEAESNKKLNAYISLNSENAIKSAEESDKRIAKNQGLSDGIIYPGMILSNEPGYYKINEYGIRTENLIIS